MPGHLFRPTLNLPAKKRSSGSGGAIAAPTLADLGCLIAAFDADLSSKTYNSGTNVSQWNDISGNGYHATSTSYPPYIANAYGSKGVMRFSGGEKFSVSIPTFQSFSIYMECTPSSTTNGYLIGGSNVGDTPSVISNFVSGRSFEYINVGSGFQPRTTVGSSLSGLNKILIMHHNNIFVRTYLNGSLVANLTPGIAVIPNGTIINFIGGNASNDNPTYDLAKIAFFSGILSASDITKIFAM